MKSVLLFVSGIAAAAAIVFLNGWLVSVVWDFALVPQGLHPMTALQGVALAALGKWIIGGTDPASAATNHLKQKTYEQKSRAILQNVTKINKPTRTL